jgi:hypothetical protein
MFAVIGLESIGDDAPHRDRVDLVRAMSGRSAPTNSAVGTHNLRRFCRYLTRPKAWVARITARDPRFGFAREFLDYKKDYTEASSTGARGVFKWYEIEEGFVVEVNAPVSWKHADRYFARASRGQLVRMAREEVEAWLDNPTFTATLEPVP